MDIAEAKNLVYGLLNQFFTGASVLHAKQSNAVKPSAPLVTLTVVSTKRALYPPQKMVDGVPVSYYPTTLMFQVDLYTRGSPVSDRPGFSVTMENTALNDLIGFANFVSSEYVLAWCNEHDISLSPAAEARDTTELLNDASYQFRATLELEMGFTHKAVGYTHLLAPSSIKHSTPEGEAAGDDGAADVTVVPEFAPSASGGGSEELAKESGGYFTEAEIIQKGESENDEP